MAFEYRYRFSVDEGIISRYCGVRRVNFIFESRTNFKVKGRIDDNGVERIIDSERYALSSVKCPKEYMHHCMGMRLKDYWMPDDEIERLINEVMLFAKQIAAGGRRGKIPVAVDVDVCTVQQEGEGIEATAERAMRPEYLPPLHTCPVDCTANPGQKRLPDGYDFILEHFLRHEVATIRVEDVEKGLSVMEVCRVCGRKPMVGTQISSLRCGHAFHYHCIVWCLEDDISCPICRHPARDPPIKVRHQLVFDYDDYVSPDDDFSDDD